MINHRVTNIAIFLLVSTASLRAEMNSNTLGALVQQHLAQSKLPAMGAVVFTDNATVAIAVRGVRKAGTKHAVTPDDQWHLGSMTKSMTGSLAAILVEERAISWTTTIGTLVPEAHADYASVTLQQLMEHRAGMSHDGKYWDKFSAQTEPPAKTRQWWVTENLKLPPPQPLGAYQYSNLGVTTAGYLLEKASGQDWERMVQAKLWKPLGITTGGFGMAGTTRGVDHPWGHDNAGQPIPAGPGDDNPRGMGPAGTVHMSLADYAKYGRWHLTNGKSKPGILPEKAFQMLHEPQAPKLPKEDPYEGGWMLAQRPWAGGLALTHSGTNTMNYSFVWLAPAKHFGLAVVCNQGGDTARAALDQLVSAIIDLGKY
jgi:CubicO group peptidase (beta-lactamase class C family)